MINLSNPTTKKNLRTDILNLKNVRIPMILTMLMFFMMSGFAQTVTKQLYLSDPDQSLDRIHPGLVTPIDNTTATSATLGYLGGGPAGSFGTPYDISQQWGGEDALTPDLAVYESGGVETLHTVFWGKHTGAAKKNIYYSTKTGAGSWSTPVIVSSDAFGNDALGFPSIAVDGNGEVHIVYAHKSGSDSKSNIYYVNNVGGSWSTPVRISSDPWNQDAYTPEIALDASGKAHVVYVHRQNENDPKDLKLNVYYTTNSSGSWSAPVKVSDDAFNQNVLNNPSITVDFNGDAHVVYSHKSGSDDKYNSYYVNNIGGSWSTSLRISNDAFGNDAFEPAVDIDVNGDAHVVYSHKSGSDDKYNIYYVTNSSGSWSTPVDLSNDVHGEDYLNPTIAISSTGIVRVAFSNNGDEISYTENSDTGGAWTTLEDINTPPTTSTDGNYPAVDITQDSVHVVYQDKHNTLSGKIDIWHNSAPLLNLPSAEIFTQTDTLCSDLVLPAGETITITVHTDVTGGSMPLSNPAISATLEDNLGNIIFSEANASYTAGSGNEGTLVWTSILPSDITVEAGGTIILTISTTIDGVTFNILYDSDSHPSQIELPTSTYINVESLDVYDAAYPNGDIITKAVQGDNVFVRVVVSDPFGAYDITGTDITITPTGTVFSATEVADDGCMKTYQYVWGLPAADQIFDAQATAKEGFENTVTSVDNTDFEVCTNCPPSAVDDYITINQGEAVKISVLDNDSDPNDNIDLGSMTITSDPDNGGTALPQSDGTIIYFPNGSFLGVETFTYEVCDFSTPDPLCSEATVTITVIEDFVDVCAEANRNHTYYLPFPEANLYTALPNACSCPGNLSSNNIRTVIAIKTPYPGTIIVYDHWEDGFEADHQNPIQLTTETWGDGNLANGVAPGYPTDILPSGASIVMDNVFNYSNPNRPTIEFDGRDKLITSSDISLSKISGDNTLNGSTLVFDVQSAKTDVYDTNRFGTSFVVPFGEDMGGEFQFTTLFIRAMIDGTSVTVDVNADGVLDGNDISNYILNEGEVLFIDGDPNNVNQNNDVRAGAAVTATHPVGLDVLFGGLDCFGTRNINILPGAFYSNVYYTPVPSTNASEPNAVYIYNSLSSTMNIDVYDNAGSVTTLNVTGGTTLKYELPASTTSGYKFENTAGESFTIIEVMDSPNASGNTGSSFDWSISLIAENRLTDFTSVAWAPGSSDLSTNTGPLWITPAATTRLYVKYDGDVTSTTASQSPCGIAYDYYVDLNELDLHQVLDSDNDQSGVALFTCDGTVFAAVYGEDAATADVASPSIDVGTLLQPMCREKNIFAVDDFEVTPPNTPVLIGVLDNDFGFLATVDPTSVITTGYLQPENGTITVNPDGAILYTPDTGFLGTDMFEYQVCSNESDPVVCDVALVTILITDCNANVNNALINGFVYLELEPDNGAYNAESFIGYRAVDLYSDANGNGIIDGADAVIQTTVASAGGVYTFAVTVIGNYIVKVNVSDGEYYAAILDEQSASITALNTCVSDLYLGLRPVLTAVDDISAGGVDQPQIISILDNDLGVPDPSTVTTSGLLQAANGMVTINPDGTVTYIPNPGYIGTDVFEYQVCSLEDPGLCDIAEVTVDVSCDFSPGENNIFGTVFYDEDLGADFDAGEARADAIIVNLYEDLDNNGMPDGAAIQTTTSDANGNYDFTLNLIYETFGSYDQKIIASTDDAAQKDNGDMKNLDDSEIKLSKKSDPNWIGLRFTNVTIPANATITSSYVYFKASDDKDAATEATIIRAQDDTQNPLTFSSTDFDISGRDLTEDFEPWVIPEWDKDLADPYYPTPNIKDVIQEVVGDVSGLDNDEIVLTFQGPANDYEHKAFTWDENEDSTEAPRLVIYYTIPGDDPYYFLTEIVTPTGTELTTDQYQTTFPDFAADGTGSCGNNFGLAQADLVTVKTLASSDATPNEGDIVSFLITVTNNGPTAASAVSLADALPSGLTATVNNGSVSQGTYSSPNWSIGDLARGASATLTLEGTVDAGQAGNTIQNITTAATGDQPDPTTEGDDLEETVDVTNTTLAENDINQTPMDTTVDGDVLTNDTDAEGDGQTVQSALADTDGDGDVDDNLPLGVPTDVYDGATLAGSMTLNADGTYTFTPATGYTGTVPMEYTAVDDNGNPVTDDATLTIEVIPVPDLSGNNNAPIAQDDVNTTEQDVNVDGNVLPNDSDPDGDAITVINALADTDGDGDLDDPLPMSTPTTVYGTDDKGQIVVAGTMTLNPDGSYTFDPAPTYIGEVPVDYTISDGNGGTDDATLTITIDPSDPADNHTYANDDANTGMQGEDQTGNILDNDNDPEGDPTTVTAATDSNGDPLTVDGITSNTLPSGGALVINTDGSYTYTPDPDFVGTEIVEYTKCDNGMPQACETATLYLTTMLNSLEVDLELTKILIDPNIEVGDMSVFSIYVVNNGPDDATGVEVIDLLPAGLTYFAHIGPGNNADYVPGTGLWTIGDLGANEATYISIMATVNTGASHTNQAEITACDQPDIDSDPTSSFGVDDLTDGIADDDEDSVTFTPWVNPGCSDITYMSALKITHDHSSNPGASNYSISYPDGTDQNGVEYTYNVTFEDDPIPAAPTYQFIPDGYDLDPNWDGTASMTYKRLDDVASSNAFFLAGDRVTEFNDFSPDPNDSYVYRSGRLYNNYGRGGFFMNSAPSGTGGHIWEYTFDFTSLANGYLPAGTWISFTDTDGLTTEVGGNGESMLVSTSGDITGPYLAFFDDAEDGTPPSCGPAYYDPVANTYYWNGPGNNSGADVNVYRSIQDLTSLTIYATHGAQGGSHSFKMTAPVIAPNHCADLELVKDVDDSSPAVGDDVTFTITVSNNDNGGFIEDAATNFDVEDVLPSGYTYVSGSIGSDANSTGAIITTNDMDPALLKWTINQLDPNESVTLTFNATAEGPTPLPNEEYLNQAQVKTMAVGEYDTDSSPGDGLGDDYDTELIYGLRLIKSISSISGTGTGLEGEVITYSFAITNTTAEYIRDVTVTDPTANVSGSPISFLAPGATNTTAYTATYTIMAVDITNGYVENSATATARSSYLVPVGSPDMLDVSDTGTDRLLDIILDPEQTETPDGIYAINGDPTDDPTVACVNPPIAGTPAAMGTCISITNGTVTVTASGGSGGYTYNLLFSATSGGIFTDAVAMEGDADGSYTGLGVGFYRVEVFDSRACTPVLSSEIEVIIIDCNTTLAENDINLTPMNIPVDGDVLTNDTDAEGDGQTVQSALADTDGDGLVDDNLPLGVPTDVYDGATLAGSMTLNADGTYTFAPAPGYNGTVPMEYTVVDDNSNPVTDDATLTIIVIPIPDPTPGNNNPPIAQDDVNTTEQDVNVDGNVLPNDSDPDGDVITVISALADTDGDGVVDDNLPIGTATAVYGTDNKGQTVVAGEMTLNADGSYTFDPQADYFGELPIDYTISDGNGGTDDATLTITIDPSDPADNHTYANDDANVGMQGDPQTGNVLDNDNDPEGDPTTVTAGKDSNGTPLTVDGATPNILPNGGTLVINTDGSYTYTPDPDFIGTEIVEYTKCDNGMPQACETATLYLITLEIACSSVQLKVLMEGPYASAKTMTTLLNDNHLLPGQDKDLSPNFAVRLKAIWTAFGQPYSPAPWSYSGNMGMGYGDASSPLATGLETPYDTDVVDWVLVTVREGGILPADNVWRCAGWLKSNSDVIFPEDCGCLIVNPLEDYYIMVEHRNHLGILTPTPANKISGTAILEWDFTTQDSYRPFVFREGQKEIAAGIWVMYAGNSQQDPGVEAINSADQTIWKNDQNDINYLFGDFNLNVVANSQDETIWKNNQNTTSGVIFY